MIVGKFLGMSSYGEYTAKEIESYKADNVHTKNLSNVEALQGVRDVFKIYRENPSSSIKMNRKMSIEFGQTLEKIMPDLYNAIQNGNVKEAVNYAKELAITLKSAFLGSVSISGDWMRFCGHSITLYKGQSVEQWEEQLPKQIDSYTGIEYFELDGYAIPTKEYRGHNYDVIIAEMADERNVSFYDIDKETIFYKSLERFGVEHPRKHGQYETSTSEYYAKDVGVSAFNRIVAYISYLAKEKRTVPTEKEIEKQLTEYMDFEKSLNAIDDENERRKLIDKELMKIIDVAVERAKELQKLFKKADERKEYIEQAIEKDELDKMFEKIRA